MLTLILTFTVTVTLTFTVTVTLTVTLSKGVGEGFDPWPGRERWYIWVYNTPGSGFGEGLG